LADLRIKKCGKCGSFACHCAQDEAKEVKKLLAKERRRDLVAKCVIL
jgi:hypothetical protein